MDDEEEEAHFSLGELEWPKLRIVKKGWLLQFLILILILA